MKSKVCKALSLAVSLSVLISMTVCGCNTESGTKNENTSNTSQTASSQAPSSDKNSENAGEMRDITSAELVKEMKIGWNLGNTLDVCQADRNGDGKLDEHAEEGEEVDETLWGNIKTTPELFDKLKSDGINAVRIPVTWRDHLDENDNIKEEWLNRVKEVVDYAYNKGFYVIINMHHDGGSDAKFGAWILEYAATDYDKFLTRYTKMWNQIADCFKNYSDKLIFEAMNEVGYDGKTYNVSENEGYEIVNRINQDFVNIIRKTGGNNAKRHLLISGFWTDVAKTCDKRFKMPTDTVENRMIISVHYYTPWEFIAGQQKTWGSNSDIKLMTDKMNQMKKNFVDKGIPVIIGEYSGGGVNKEQTYYCEYLVKLCTDMGAATFLWDNGGILNRTTLEWRVKGLIEGLNRAVSGEDYQVVKGE